MLFRNQIVRSRSRFGRTLVALVFSIPLAARANISCTGPVTYLGTNDSGSVYVAAGMQINVICSTVTQGSYTASPQACKLFYASLLADQLAGRSPTVFYSDPALTDCSQIGSWSVQPSVYFVST